jgi:hypothetical protein
MNKIEKLTTEQEAKMSEYVSKWTERGLTTTQRSLEDAQIDFHNFQKIVLKKDKPAKVVLVKSPLEANKLIKKMYFKDTDKMKCFYPYFDCQYWAGWFSFYEFMEKELGVKYDNKVEYDAMCACSGYGMVYPLDDICIVVQPPTIIKKNANGLHCENGPALSYDGDNELYALNNVVMPKHYVLTDSHEITGEMIFKETNVEIRRELIRKVGIEQIFEKMPHKLLDRQDEYELYSIELSEEVKDARYLKMTNPSIGCFHMEGVAPEISTVKDALKWRNQNMFENADVLT